MASQWNENIKENDNHTFQIINGFLQFGHRPLGKLSTGLSLAEKYMCDHTVTKTLHNK